MEQGTITFGTGGPITILLNNAGVPAEYELIASERTGGDDKARVSRGSSNGTTQECSAFIFDDTEGGLTKRYTDRVVGHIGVVSGNIEEILRVNNVGVDDGEIDVTVATANINYSCALKSKVY